MTYCSSSISALSRSPSSRPEPISSAQAKLDIATQDVQRATPLAQSQTLTQREFDTRKSVQRDAAGQLDSANATLKQAELNLEWTEVRAPIAGRISDKRVDAGNLITGGQTGATLLSVIVSIDPIHFVFDGSETDFLHYLRLAAAGERPSSRDAQNPVAVRLADETEYTHHGANGFRRQCRQSQDRHHPGSRHLRQQGWLSYAGILRPASAVRRNAPGPLIPDSAIASDQASKIVFTVAEDGTVGTKHIKIGPIIDGLRVVRSGLQPTDRIVIDGLPRARPGQKVKAEDGTIKAASK